MTVQIEKTEQQLESLHTEMAKATFYELANDKQTVCYSQADALEARLIELMDQWEQLEAS